MLSSARSLFTAQPQECSVSRPWEQQTVLSPGRSLKTWFQVWKSDAEFAGTRQQPLPAKSLQETSLQLERERFPLKQGASRAGQVSRPQGFPVPRGCPARARCAPVAASWTRARVHADCSSGTGPDLLLNWLLCKDLCCFPRSCRPAPPQAPAGRPGCAPGD